MRIAMVASECEPWAKTGGLADVVDALSRALGLPEPAGPGHEVDVYLPYYRGLTPPRGLVPLELRVPMRGADGAARKEPVTLWSGEADGYRLRLVEHGPSFDRASYYMDGTSDYADNPARFTLLGRAALEAMRAEARPVDVIHGHDWQAAPALLSLRQRYGSDPLLARSTTMLTCHNLAYHGWTPLADEWQLDLPERVGRNPDGTDLLREAIEAADIVNTVSPNYARESLTPEYGAGLDEVLRARGDRYIGIINGIDTGLWDPASDATLVAPYDGSDLAPKALTKADLAERVGLDPDGPLLGVIGRLDPQKGFDLVTEAAPQLVDMGARLIVLGTGHPELISGLQAQAVARPDRIAVLDRFDRDEARRIYAGADLFLMPSRFEPCGQGQLIAMRYATPPVVRASGGLADTVIDADDEPALGTGFVFGPAHPAALVEAVRRAFVAMDDPARFRAIQANGMARDHSWRVPAREYEAAYRRAISGR
ncbi:MAG: glycogen/starch synthase [Candidatus Limnocylindrales bacterium]